MLEEKIDALAPDVVRGPMRQAAPVRHFSAQQEWQATDAEVRESVSDYYSDLDIRGDLSGAQCGANTGITAAYDQNARHQTPVPFWGTQAEACTGRARRPVRPASCP
jgi:hypothetical protein